MRNQVFKKLFSVLLALIMVAGLLPASVLAEGEGNADSTPAPTEAVQPTESAEPTAPTETETPEVTEIPEPTPENPATTVEPTQGEPTAEPTDEGIMPANVMPVQANVELQYRIVHLDCGREYFTKDWIIALINEMADAGYNQLQLAFGNGGFRFYLNNMAVGSYSHEQVMGALEAGNKHYNIYGDGENGPTNSEWITYNPSVNALTQTEMDTIIKHAQSKGIEIVPMLNTPGHMHAVLTAMSELGISGNLQVSGKPGCLNLENTVAVSFTKELVSKYVKYFADNGCNFFNAAMDEYSSWENVFYNYANDIISIITGNNMTPRMFNDALRSNNTISNSNVQVCYWFYGNDCYPVGQITQYQLINANHDYYYVSTNENWNLYREGYTFVGEYNEDTWINKAKQFNNNTFNYGSGVGTPVNNPVGSMFCIWCNTPGKNTETQIAQQIRMILRVIGARMQNSDIYSASNELVEGGFKADGTINVPTNNKTVVNNNNTVRVTGPNLAALKCETATVTIQGAAEGKIAAYDVTPSTADNNKYTGEAEVRIKIPAEWDSSKVIAFIVENDGTAKDIIGTATEDGWYVFTAPHFSVMGIYEKAVELENVVLPINLWITNTGVVPTNWSNGTPAEFTYNDDGGNRRSIYTLKASHSTVNSPNGISLSSILPQVTGTAKSWDNNTYNVTYWKNAYHTAENRQSTDGWTNYSHKGTKFEYIRFYECSWAYSVDGITWVNIENVGAGATDTDKNQVCIWYRQVTTVTSEVTTEIVDWGPIKYGANQCLLDFAVKYDGTENRIPNSFPVTGKTIGFDCPTDQPVPLGNGYVVQDTDGTYYRTVYGIAGVETAEYEVYMITVTPTSDTHTDYITKGTKPTESNGYPYGGTEKIAWAKTEADANSTELNKMPNVKYGGEPFLESVKIYQYQGLLVTYYLRAKQTPDSLTVHYAIQGSETAFYEYNIAVNQGTTFNSGIALDPKQDPKVGGPLLYGTVTNSNNETITVSSNLATLQGLEPQYRYSKYEIVGFRKDDKNVWIYYTFTREYTYVIDFGLPLKIKFSDFGVTNDAAIETVSLWEKEIVLENKGLYGTANVIMNDTEGKYVLYTLDKPLDKNITIPLYVKFSQKGDNDKPQLFTANIIPATNVYYEDSFAKFYGSDGKQQTVFNQTSAGDVAGTWYAAKDTSAENNANTAQALEALGQADHNPYGYDSAYNNCTMFSMGSARKVTVTSDMAKDGVVWPTAQFTFKGTGFDIISLTDNTSGAIFVDVTGKSTNKTKTYVVNNYYGYKYDEATNTWEADTTGGNNALYQIPVIAVRGLDYDEYNVVITVAYNTLFDKTKNSEYSFWLDAVRVYDPMGKSENTGNTYGQDGEAYPQYIKLRSELKELNSDGTASSGALFIDGKENANISEYANYGPNNEVYLAKGQAITFKLTGNLDKIAAVQIGAKSPNSSAEKTATMKVGTDVKQEILGTATEMYYDISAVKDGRIVTITNTGEAILSLTNLKITFTEGNHTVSLDKVSAELQTQAVQMVRALFAPAPVEPEPEPEPEKTFEPERFEASWSRNVMQGRKATLTVKTSEDVEAITVDGQTIRSYRTRTERMGFGRRAKRITYREFTYSMVAQESADFSVTAINAEGTESEAITARLTVKTRPNSMRDMWDWFKGWF